MLKLKNISKQYLNQKVLNQINITFRKKEFVSILGPSGSGKTTLLNIIGALEKPDEGEIIVGGITTKKYKQTMFDSYRNQLVGMIFQDYNIIEHLTVLENVELGQIIKEKKEKQKAIKILETLGLKNEINKYPNQLSGGQKQRVAIARAIVNEPNIILADEPTGALDSKASKEIMEILQKISQKKLVIMVTHNEELANKYSSRIIKIKDGVIKKDTNPYEEVKMEKITLKKTKISLLNSLHISLKNLLTKKGRTILVSFASSIGILGIALVLSLSNGVNKYIKETEQEYVENYPITIYKQLNLLNLTLTEETNSFGQDGIITSTSDITNKILNQNIKYNDMQTLKKYLDKGALNEYITEIKYNYYIEPQLYTKNYNKVEYNQENIYYELSNNDEIIKKNYELLKGKIPKNKNEIALIISKNNTINDSLLYALEIKNKRELPHIYNEILEHKKIEETKYNYDEILNKTYKLILNTEYFQKENKIYVNKTNNKEYMKKIIDKALDVKIVGILKPKNDITIDNLIAYRSTLTNYLIKENKNTTLGKEQYQNKKKIF